jgi:hypothetical protein
MPDLLANRRNLMQLKLIATALAANLMAITAAIALDANLPAYQAVSGISGQLKSVGSDTLNNEMERWAKGFEAQYPGVEIEIEGKGSATAGGLVGADATAINERTFVFKRMYRRGQRRQHMLLVLRHNPTLCSCSIQE